MATVHRGLEMWGGGQVVKKIYHTGPWKLITIPLYIPLKSPVGAHVQYIKLSVADPGCLSRILIYLHILDPESRISDPKTATKERGEKFFLHTFFVPPNFTTL
jgi:hypothetical protein